MGALLCRSARLLPSTRTLAAVGLTCQADAGGCLWCPQDPESEFGTASNDDLIAKNMAMRIQKQEVRACLTLWKLQTPLGCWSVLWRQES